MYIMVIIIIIIMIVIILMIINNNNNDNNICRYIHIKRVAHAALPAPGPGAKGHRPRPPP